MHRPSSAHIAVPRLPRRAAAMADAGQALRDPHFGVRFTEMVFAIIAFSVVAEGSGYSRREAGAGSHGSAAEGVLQSWGAVQVVQLPPPPA